MRSAMGYILGSNRSRPERTVAAVLGCCRKQRGGGSTLEARLATLCHKLQHIAALAPAGCYHRQDGGHIPAALDTGCPVTALPPQHRVPQRTLRRVIGRLHAFPTQERPQRRP